MTVAVRVRVPSLSSLYLTPWPSSGCLLKNPGMKNCESFCWLVRRYEKAGQSPATEEQRDQTAKRPQPAGAASIAVGESRKPQPRISSDFLLWDFSTGAGAGGCNPSCAGANPVGVFLPFELQTIPSTISAENGHNSHSSKNVSFKRPRKTSQSPHDEHPPPEHRSRPQPQLAGDQHQDAGGYLLPDGHRRRHGPRHQGERLDGPHKMG